MSEPRAIIVTVRTEWNGGTDNASIVRFEAPSVWGTTPDEVRLRVQLLLEGSGMLGAPGALTGGDPGAGPTRVALVDVRWKRDAVS